MRRWLPLLLLAALGLVLGLEQERAWPWLGRHDKLVHAVGLALLAFALRLAWPRWHAGALMAACAAAALGLEALQALVPGRTPSWDDVAAGIAGAAAALVVPYVRLVGRQRMEDGEE